MIVGFTGTRKGMTEAQLRAFQITIQALDTPDLVITQAHHGDCVGADAQFHDFMKNVRKVETHGHPPLNKVHRAFCDVDTEYTAREYNTRNRAIVHASTVMIGCPDTETWRLHSGTWTTINYAKRMKKPLMIIFPSGVFVRENGLVLPGDTNQRKAT